MPGGAQHLQSHERRVLLAVDDHDDLPAGEVRIGNKLGQRRQLLEVLADMVESICEELTVVQVRLLPKEPAGVHRSCDGAG